MASNGQNFHSIVFFSFYIQFSFRYYITVAHTALKGRTLTSDWLFREQITCGLVLRTKLKLWMPRSVALQPQSYLEQYSHDFIRFHSFEVHQGHEYRMDSLSHVYCQNSVFGRLDMLLFRIVSTKQGLQIPHGPEPAPRTSPFRWTVMLSVFMYILALCM